MLWLHKMVEFLTKKCLYNKDEDDRMWFNRF